MGYIHVITGPKTKVAQPQAITGNSGNAETTTASGTAGTAGTTHNVGNTPPAGTTHNIGNTPPAGTLPGPKGKKRATDIEDKAPRKKRTRTKFKSNEFVESDQDDEVQAGPSTELSLKGKGRAKADGRPEEYEHMKGSKVSHKVCQYFSASGMRILVDL